MIKKILPLIVSATFFMPAQVSAAPMTLSVHDADLRSTIMLVAKTGGLNVSIDDSVKGKISISLSNVEPLKILEIISRTKSLQMMREAGVYIVTASSVEVMQSYVFPIKFGDAEILKEAVIMSLDPDTEKLPNQTTRIKNADGSYTYRYTYRDDDNDGGDDYSENVKRKDRVYVNPEVNALILFGTPAEYERVKKLLETLDVELKQVSVEAKILAIDKNATKNLGVEWMWSTVPQYPEHDRDTYTRTNSDGVVTYHEENSYTRNSNETTGFGIIRFGRSHEGYPYEFYYGARINALVTDGKAKILSRPNVTTIQGKEAVINVGSSVPVPKISSTSTATTTEFDYRDAGIILKYTPRINADGTITATIHTEVSTPQYVADMGAYRFNTRSADTTVTVRDGEPMVIGGLIGAEEAKSVSKIPFLGDLPILGALFRNHRKSKSESELVIFLTAKVLEGNSNETVPFKP
ncbi:MAG: type II secretion system protein GspD [Selenomonadaceae bacterium]|nr:type II secretion system protein GspD [Selenomonadaceae bacterium]